MIRRFEAAWEDPASRTRILRWFWIVSTGFTLLGFALILYLVLLR